MDMNGSAWAAIDDCAQLFKCENLDILLSTDRENDVDDYVALFGEEVKTSRPFINIGAGDWQHPLWRNHDYVQPPYHNYTKPDYNIDLSKFDPWPIESSTFLAAYCSHTIEHLTDEMASYIFSETARILKQGGVFRITCPDFYTAYVAWRLGDMRYYDHRSTGRLRGTEASLPTNKGFAKGKSLNNLYFERIASCFGSIKEFGGMPISEFLETVHRGSVPEQGAIAILANADFSTKKPNQHINFWTENKFREMLTAAGFRLVLRSSYGQCIVPTMRNKAYFDRTRPNETIWIDAVK